MTHNPPDILDVIEKAMLEDGFDPAYIKAYKEYWSGEPENLRTNYPDIYRHFQMGPALQLLHMKQVTARHDSEGKQLNEAVQAQENPHRVEESSPDYVEKPATGKKERPVLDQFNRYPEQEAADKELIRKGYITEGLAERKNKSKKHNQVLCGFIILATEFYGYLKDFDYTKKDRRRKMTLHEKQNFYKKRFKMDDIRQIRTRRQKCIDAALECLDCMRKDELFLKGKIPWNVSEKM